MSLLFDPLQPNKQSLESLEETEELVESENPGYDSLEAMFDSMGV